MKILREVGITILIAVAIFAALKLTIPNYIVQYSSMLPNIEEGERIIVNRASYFFSDPNQGEVIVFKPPPPNNPDEKFIKRIIALPGDTIEVKDKKVLVNGIPLEEEYIRDPPRYTMAAKTIPEGEYFVLGDNRNNSNDSHHWGTVPRDNIVGKAWFIYWPLERWGPIKHYSYPELTETSGVTNLQSNGGATWATTLLRCSK